MKAALGPLLALLAAPASANDDPEFDIHSAVLAEAFDPEKLFQDEYGFAPLLTVRYLGDDWGYPVYALALFKGCHVDDPEGDRSCRDRLQARMIRAPYDGEPERPRWRGTRLLSNLAERGVSSLEELREALDLGAVEWMQANLADCPAALSHARNTDDLSWFGEPLVTDPSDEISIIIHYDTVSVRFRPNYYTDLRYDGHIDDDLPSGWARDFATALEDCWEPATATLPWRRKPIEDQDEE